MSPKTPAMDSARVLVLEDDPDFREMLVRLLAKEGYSVDGAAKGIEALELARKTEYDLVITDIRLEGLDGLATLSKLMQSQPYIGSLVMTGYSNEEDSIRAVRLGVGDYLRKPFRLDDFVGAVRRLITDGMRKKALQKERTSSLRSMRRLSEALSRAWEQQDNPVAKKAGQIAKRLLHSLKLSPEIAEVALLLTYLVALDDTESDLYDEEDLPAGLELGLRHLEEHWDGSGVPEGLAEGSIPMESRVARFALAIAREEENWEGRFDPVLIAIQQLPADPVFPLEERSASVRSLVSYARAMEESGDLPAAEAAFQEVTLKRSPTREGVEARLALARLAKRRGALLEVGEHLRQANHMASQVGPSVTAGAALKAGILTAQCGLPGAERFLQEAVRMSRSLRSTVGFALGTLASAALLKSDIPVEMRQKCLQTLMGTEYTGDLAGAASWLLPYLWSTDRNTELHQSVIKRLCREAPKDWEQFYDSVDEADRNALKPFLTPRNEPTTASRSLPAQASASQPEVPLLRIYSLGPFEVYHGTERIGERGWRSQKARYLLGFLASSNRPVPEEKIIDEFWPDDFEKGKRNLYWCTSVLRSKLKLEAWPQVDYLSRSGGALALSSEFPVWHDLNEMDNHFSLAQKQLEAGDTAAASDAYRRVVGLYRGPYLEGCYMSWTDPLGRKVESQITQALLFLLSSSSDSRKWDEALEHASLLLQIDPCCQEAYLAVMQAQTALGRPEEAVRVYDRCETVLEEELGISPNAELVQLRGMLD